MASTPGRSLDTSSRSALKLNLSNLVYSPRKPSDGLSSRLDVSTTSATTTSTGRRSFASPLSSRSGRPSPRWLPAEQLDRQSSATHPDSATNPSNSGNATNPAKAAHPGNAVLPSLPAAVGEFLPPKRVRPNRGLMAGCKSGPLSTVNCPGTKSRSLEGAGPTRTSRTRMRSTEEGRVQDQNHVQLAVKKGARHKTEFSVEILGRYQLELVTIANDPVNICGLAAEEEQTFRPCERGGLFGRVQPWGPPLAKSRRQLEVPPSLDIPPFNLAREDGQLALHRRSSSEGEQRPPPSDNFSAQHIRTPSKSLSKDCSFSSEGVTAEDRKELLKSVATWYRNQQNQSFRSRTFRRIFQNSAKQSSGERHVHAIAPPPFKKTKSFAACGEVPSRCPCYSPPSSDECDTGDRLTSQPSLQFSQLSSQPSLQFSQLSSQPSSQASQLSTQQSSPVEESSVHGPGPESLSQHASPTTVHETDQIQTESFPAAVSKNTSAKFVAVAKKAPPMHKKAPQLKKNEKDDYDETQINFEWHKFIKPPARGLVSRKVNWVSMPVEKLQGTVWEGMLEEDAQKPLAVEEMIGNRLEIPVEVGASLALPVAQMRRGTFSLLAEDHSGKNGPDGLATGAALEKGDVLRKKTGLRRRSLSARPKYFWEVDEEEEFSACSFQPDYEELDRHFFKREGAEKERRSAAAGVSPKSPANAKKPAGVLDAMRSQNLEISLKGLGVFYDATPVKKAIANLDMLFSEADRRVLGEDICGTKQTNGEEKLLCVEELKVIKTLLPTPEEKEVLERSLEHQMTSAEVILADWIKIPFLRKRLECCCVMASYADEAEKLCDRTSKFENCLASVHKVLRKPPGALQSLLALCLKVGNYLNFEVKRKRALGIEIRSLEALKATSSFDSASDVNLLKCIASVIDHQRPSLWNSIAPAVGLASEVLGMTPADNLLTCSSLELGVSCVCNELKLATTEAVVVGPAACYSGRFLAAMTRFSHVASHQLDSLRNRNEAVKIELIKLGKKFDPTVATPEDSLQCLGSLVSFWTGLVKARDDKRKKVVEEAWQGLRKGKKL